MDKNTFIQLAKEAYQLTLLFPNKEPLRYKIREVANDILAGFIIKENDYLGDIKSQMEVIDGFFDIAMTQDWTSPAKIKEIKDDYIHASLELEEMRMFGQKISEPSAKEEKKTDFVLVPGDKKAEVSHPLPQSVIEPLRPAKPMVVPQTTAAAKTADIGETIFDVMGGEEAVRAESENAIEESDDAALTGSQILRQNRILEFLKEKGNAQVWEIQKIFPNVSKRTIRRDFRSMLKQGVIERTGERNTTAYKLKINLA
jgi:hypothetical protein